MQLGLGCPLAYGTQSCIWGCRLGHGVISAIRTRYVVAPDTLTLGAFTIATVMIAKTSGDGEIMAAGIASAVVPSMVLQGAHGGIRLMSVLESQPGHVGFFRVVSTKVQRSPL